MVSEWVINGQEWPRKVDGGLALALLQQVGRAGFAEALLKQVNTHAAFGHCTLYELELDAETPLVCKVVDAASQHSVPTAQRTSTLFAQRFSQLDVNRRLLGRPHAGATQFGTYFLARDLPHHDYRDACYVRNGLADRFSLVSVVQPGRAIALNFYKSLAHGPTAQREREQLLWNAPLLLQAAVRHAALLRPVPSRGGADLLARLPSHSPLTPREAQLCRLLLEGLTVDEAASRMGIRPTSAITLKRRGFARLGVRTREELVRRAAG